MGTVTKKSKTRGDVFADWIDNVGVERIAKSLKISRITVINWRDGWCDPRVSQMVKIKKFSGGAIGYTEIIDRTCRIGVHGKRLGAR